MSKDDPFHQLVNDVFATPEMLSDLETLAVHMAERLPATIDRHFEIWTEIGSVCLCYGFDDSAEDEWTANVAVIANDIKDPFFAVGINHKERVIHQDPLIDAVEDLTAEQAVELEAANTICDRAKKEDDGLSPLELGIIDATQNAISLLLTGDFKPKKQEPGRNSVVRKLDLGESIKEAVLKRNGTLEVIWDYRWPIHPSSPNETIDIVLSRTIHSDEAFDQNDDEEPVIQILYRNIPEIISHAYVLFNSGRRILESQDRDEALDDIDRELIMLSNNDPSHDGDQNNRDEDDETDHSDFMPSAVIRLLIDKLNEAIANNPDAEDESDLD